MRRKINFNFLIMNRLQIADNGGHCLFSWQKSRIYLGREWQDPANMSISAALCPEKNVLLRHFCEAVAEGVDDQLEPV